MARRPYYVLLDSNVWISERLLYSSLGAALFHALTKDGAAIAVPEIVTREVEDTILRECERQVGQTQKAIQYLRQISQHRIDVVIPNQATIRDAIRQRWEKLGGLLQEIEFTFDHAKAALNRILEKQPPCGKDNEQFRDCCIWQCAVELTDDAPVHIVSNDYAFYQGGRRDAGLAQPLADEVNRLKHPISMNADLDGFLRSQGTAPVKVDEAALQKLIAEATIRLAEQWAAEKEVNTSIEGVRSNRITGYATPKPNVVAVAFSTAFDTSRRDEQGKVVFSGGLTLTGSCSYNPTTGEISEVKIRSWKSYRPGGEEGHWSGRASYEVMSQYREGDFRLL